MTAGPGMLNWIARGLVLAILAIGTWMAIQPELNLAHFTPNRLMRRIGLPYDAILGYEHYMHWALHFLVALALTVLLYACRLFGNLATRWAALLSATLIAALALTAETVQHFIGRGMDMADIAFGLAGVIAGLLLLLRMSHKPGYSGQA